MPSRCRALIISNWSCEMEEKSDMTDFWLQQERIALFRRLEKCEQPIMCLDCILPIQLIEKVGKVYKEQFEAHGCQFILGQKSWIYIRIVKGQLTQFFRRWNQTGLWSGECGRTLRSLVKCYEAGAGSGSMCPVQISLLWMRKENIFISYLKVVLNISFCQPVLML